MLSQVFPGTVRWYSMKCLKKLNLEQVQKMTNSTSVSFGGCYWLGVFWLQFMPAIPLPFEGRGVRKWQSYVQVLHMIGDQRGITNLPVCPLAKICTGRGNIWCEMNERDFLCWTVEQQASMNVIALSTLIRMRLQLAGPFLWLNLENGLRMKWKFAALRDHCFIETGDNDHQEEILCYRHFQNNNNTNLNGNINSYTACHFQFESSPSVTDMNASAEWIPMNVLSYYSNLYSLKP